MNDQPQIKDIFFEAVKMETGPHRDLYLSEACAGDDGLRRRVEALLAAHAQPESYLERPAADFQLGVTNGPSPQRQPVSDRVAEQVGSVIGPYKLLEQIGEGGMGVVYMAEQKEPVRRKVALKIIKPGMDTRQVVARFEAERQALAIMDHPNIAHVLDAGSTESSRPYFVMELVRGIPVTQYCDQNKLSTKARLELFVSVCRAVQHAHTKGIIHRDIKPTNVLVTLHDGVPVPKIIDFGVAKAINQDLTEKTLFTAFAQMIGTPLYMSPEQAEMSGLDIDTRSDIYALGVLLYELLTGVTPLDKQRIQTAAYDEVRRIIREEQPAKPSTRVSSLGDSSPAVCSQRRTDANKLHQQLRGELDWIVMTSLEKDRTRRYQSASEFAEDVGRHLSGEAVRACPPTVGYRFRTFARRYKTQVALVSAFLFLLLTSSAVAWILLAQARQAAATARLEQKKTLAAKDDLQTEKSRAEENYRLAEDRRVQLQEKLYDYSWLQATAAYSENDTSRVAESLKDCPEPLRGWEWYYLQRMTAPERTVNMGEHPLVWFDSCRVNPRIVALDNNGNLSVRDLTNGRELWSCKTEIKQPFAVRFSADGNQIGVSSSPFVLPGCVQIWNAATGQMVRSLRSENEAVTMADFSPDGRFLALGTVPIFGTKGHVQLWDLATQEQVWTNSCKGFPTFVFSHDSQRLYLSLMFYGSWERASTLCCWEVDKPKEVWSVDRNSTSLPDLSADGTKLLLGGLNHSLELRDVASGAIINQLESTRPDTAIYARFSSNDRYVVSRGDSGTVVLWNWESKKEVLSIQTPGHRALGPVAFTTDGRHFAVESTSLTGVQLRATSPLSPGMTLAGHEKLVNAVCFSPDGTKVLSISVDGALRTWNTLTGEESNARIVKSPAYTVACSPDGNYIATGGGKEVTLWNASSGEPIHLWEEAGGVWWIDFSSNGDRVVTGGGKAGIMVWNTKDGKRIQTFPLKGRRFDGLVFLDDAQQVASLMGTSGRLDIWDVDTGASEMLGPAPHVPMARSLAFNRKHNTLAAGILTQVVLCDLENKQLRAGLTGHDYPVHTVTFSPDGTRLFSGDADGVIKVWNWRTGKELFSMQAHESTGSNWGKVGVRSLALSPDGTTLASAGADGLVKLWKTTRSPDGLATK